MKALILAVIRAYRYLLSPWWGRQCRFMPTCSEFAQEAVERHGLFKGGSLSMRRIACCHAWHAGGFDPVP